MDFEKGYFEVDASTAQKLADECNLRGGRVFSIAGEDYSKDGFFESVRRGLPLAPPPPLQSNRSWDALADSLWAGLDDIQENLIVILWKNARELERGAPEDFAVASSILKDLPELLANAEITAGPIKFLLVLKVI